MIIPYITYKQQEIPKLIYRFRFLNTVQIQRFMHHKDKSRINKWLKQLYLLEYMQRIYDPKKFGENTKLAIYYSGLNGIRFLKAQEGFTQNVFQKLYHDKNRSEAFINECVFIADCCLTLEDQSKNGRILGYLTESDLASPSSPYHFLTKVDPKIDPKIIYSRQTGKAKKYFLLDYFEPSLKNHHIKKRIRNHLDFYFSSEWEKRISSSFPTIQLIFTTKAKMIYAKRYSKTLLNVDHPAHFHIKFSFEDNVRKHGILNNEIWEKVKT